MEKDSVQARFDSLANLERAYVRGIRQGAVAGATLGGMLCLIVLWWLNGCHPAWAGIACMCPMAASAVFLLS